MLALLLLGGIGAMLTRGVSRAGIQLQLIATDGWRTGQMAYLDSDESIHGGWAVTRVTNLGFFGIAITRVEDYHTVGEPGRPAGRPSSAPSSTAPS